MVKIDRPESLFGKYPYIVEQQLVLTTFKEIEGGALNVEPTLTRIVGIELIPIELMRPEKRREKAREHFTRALKILKNMGV